MWSKNTVELLAEMLSHHPEVLIVMHRNPDGDAVGASLGWKHVLSEVGIPATVMAPDAFPKFLQWLPGQEEIVICETSAQRARAAVAAADLIFCMDCNAPARLGPAEKLILEANKPVVVIDHHRDPEDFAMAYYVDDAASSTAEMVYRLVKGLGWRRKLHRNAAICLYTGIVTDTGSFRFPAVTPKLLRIASRLLETGMDHVKVYEEVYDSVRESRLRLRGFALAERLRVWPELAAACIFLTAEDLAKYNHQKGDTEGLVNEALSLEGIALAAFFSEKDGAVKVSLRSKGSLDVNVLARTYFNGGGHVNAAGGIVHRPMQEVLKLFEEVAAAVHARRKEVLPS